MRSIVVGYDGSQHAERAVERAAELANGGHITLVEASDQPRPPEPDVGGLEETKARKRELAEAKARLADRGLDVNAVLGMGDPAESIVEEAEKAGADLIIVGTRGLTGVKKMLLGSVSSKVVEQASCDVLVVR